MSLSYQIKINDPSHSHLSPTLLSNLTLVESPVPTPGPSTVLVRIHAAALNFRDLLAVADSPLYPVRTVAGLIPCSDGAGSIVAAGPQSKWSDSVGEHVILLPSHDWEDGDVEVVNLSNIIGAGKANGTLSQYVVVGDEWVVKAPRNMSFEEAAALPGAAGTAINVLDSVEVGKGTTVVTQGTGGVSCAVIQYAAALGARVIATSSTDEKLQIAKSLGASDLINYKTTPNWADEVLKLTGGRGADLICEVGGSGTLEQSVKALRQGGTACLVGFLTIPEPVNVLMSLIAEAKKLKGILVFSKKMLLRAVELAEKHDLHPYVAKVYDWEHASEAFEQMRKQNTVGKIVIKV